MYEYRVVSTDIAGRATVEIRNGNGVWQEAGRAEDY